MNTPKLNFLYIAWELCKGSFSEEEKEFCAGYLIGALYGSTAAQPEHQAVIPRKQTSKKALHDVKFVL